ncbi:MAG: pantoate--beta-alanine ligase [Bacteroidetes bacterium]|nr:pantoate--beta-alanine ligase [Bacteroidota bacterium]MDF1867090.1 pantoate--beta-alanine ligase [Saprospiraceae bacterium]
MLLFKRIADLKKYLQTQKSTGKSIGFAPTMGALHEGHLSLIKRTKEENDCSVCSIFVNPTQFNEASDLEKYPQTPEKDIDLLISVGCDVLFMPNPEEVYPKGQLSDLKLDFGNLDKVMEGEHRPGHFEGVAQVVNRLLEIVEPDRLYMGQKDFQQFTIIQRMLVLTNSNTYLRVCPIVREEHGLAMSSRNVLLSPVLRKRAALIYETLSETKENMHALFPNQLKAIAFEKLNVPHFKPEYFEIIEGQTLMPIEVLEDVDYAVACVAVWVDGVRLIDNIILKKE